MRRIMVLLTVAALMAALMVAMALPAFAGGGGTCHYTEAGSNCVILGGSRSGNGLYHDQTNTQSDMILIQIISHEHGSGDPVVGICNDNDKGQDQNCHAN